MIMAVAALAIVAVIGMLYSAYRAMMASEANVSAKRWLILIAASALTLAATPILSWIPWPWGLTTP
jgi:hypothetical protein